MGHSTSDIQKQAKENLRKAFQQLKSRHIACTNGKLELDYAGNNSIRKRLEDTQNQLNDLQKKIEEEEVSCDQYLQQYCPHFYQETFNSHVSQWITDRNSVEEKNAKERIAKALRNIDEYAKNRSQELANSFADALKCRFDDISSYGIGRPWGTEIRQRLAAVAGLKTEVNNLWELGLNSVANSKHVYLGPHFINLIKKDDAMMEIRQMIDTKVIADIKKHTPRTPSLSVQVITGKIADSESKEFGGKRSSDDMFKQLKFTLIHPLGSFRKYADTWNAAMNELTWTIRHATVRYAGIYHAVYNITGFIFLWEMLFSIEDKYDLRPRSGRKIDFKGAYNIATTILGTAYHDICGNTDKMKIRAYWKEINDCQGKINLW